MSRPRARQAQCALGETMSADSTHTCFDCSIRHGAMGESSSTKAAPRGTVYCGPISVIAPSLRDCLVFARRGV
jgi:hypothetical protein